MVERNAKLRNCLETPPVPKLSQDFREFSDHNVTVIHVLDRELTLIRRWVQVKKYFALITGEKYLHIDPLACRIAAEAAVGGTQLFLSQDDKLEGQRGNPANVGWYGFGLPALSSSQPEGCARWSQVR